MKTTFRFIKKYFWEKWLLGMTALLGILGFPTFLVEMLQKEISISYSWIAFSIWIVAGLCWGIFVEKTKLSAKEKEKPGYCDYKTDIIDGCKYEWVWDYDSESKSCRVERFIQICLTCNYEILKGKCKCKASSNNLHIAKPREEILAQIRHNIQKQYGTLQVEIF